jgi:hypothetical protein
MNREGTQRNRSFFLCFRPPYSPLRAFRAFVEEDGDPFYNLAKATLSYAYEQSIDERVAWTVEQIQKSRTDGMIFLKIILYLQPPRPMRPGWRRGKSERNRGPERWSELFPRRQAPHFLV